MWIMILILWFKIILKVILISDNFLRFDFGHDFKSIKLSWFWFDISNMILPNTVNGPLSGTTHVSRYQKGKTNLDFTEARDSEWQWHQQGHMQVCISLKTDNHASTPPLVFYRPDALPATQPTALKHWTLHDFKTKINLQLKHNANV